MTLEHFEVTETDLATIIKILPQEIDLAQVGGIRKEFQGIPDGGKKNIVIDLENLHFIDSAGIGWLISVHQQNKKKLINVGFIKVKKELTDIFALTSIDKLLKIYPDYDTFMAAVG